MAVPYNRYELRSTEVQEVMNKPPSLLISWGNSLIVLIIVLAMIAINKVEMPVKEHLPARYEKQVSALQPDVRGATGKIIFSLSTSLPASIKIKQPVKVILDNPGFENMGALHTTIDSVWTSAGKTFILLNSGNEKLITNNGRVLYPPEGMIARLDIVTGRMNVFRFLMHNLFRA